MVRLTAWDKKDNSKTAYGIKCFSDECLKRKEKNEGNDEACDGQCIYEFYERLAKYEDTGLTPKEIMEINDFSNSQCMKLLAENQVLKAERNSAIADLAMNDCDTCKFIDNYSDVEPCKKCCVINDLVSDVSYWEWRGVLKCYE